MLLVKDPKKRGKYKDLMKTPFITQEKTPTFLPRTTLETAPSMSFIGRFPPVPDAELKHNQPNANDNG